MGKSQEGLEVALLAVGFGGGVQRAEVGGLTPGEELPQLQAEPDPLAPAGLSSAGPSPWSSCEQGAERSGRGVGPPTPTSPLCHGGGAGEGRARQGGGGLGSALGFLGSLACLFPGVVGGPQRQVVSQQLHDEGAVFVGVLAEGVQVSHGLIEGGLGQ